MQKEEEEDEEDETRRMRSKGITGQAELHHWTI